MYIDIPTIKAMAETVREVLGEDCDAETFLDTLDGETDAADILTGLVKERQEALANAQAINTLVATYGARKARMEAHAKAVSGIAADVLDAMGERKVVLPIATLSRTKARTRMEITDETAIPSQLTVTTVKPDSAAIKAQLEAGETVPGAKLETGPEGLTIRIK